MCAGNIRGNTNYQPGQWFTAADLQREYPFHSNQPILFSLPGKIIEESIAFSRRLAEFKPQCKHIISYTMLYYQNVTIVW